MDITVTPAATEGRDRAILRNMFIDFYTTLSAYDPNLVINANGLPTWEPAGVEESNTDEGWWRINWWIRDQCANYILRVDGVPAGFAMIITAGDPLPEGVDYELLAFHITPKYRRKGIGRIAAHQLFDLYKGTWAVFELEDNLPARWFWEQVIGEYTNGNYEMLDGGTQQRFNNRSE
jgi:predicted acetyltransferase